MKPNNRLTKGPAVGGIILLWIIVALLGKSFGFTTEAILIGAACTAVILAAWFRYWAAVAVGVVCAGLLALTFVNSRSAAPPTTMYSALEKQVGNAQVIFAKNVDRVLDGVNKKIDSSKFILDSVQESKYFEVAGAVHSTTKTFQQILDSAGGQSKSQTLSVVLPASTVAWTNVFTVPNGKTIELCAEQTLLTKFGEFSVGPEGLPEVVTAEEAERDGYPMVGQRKLAVLARLTDPENGGGEVHALANNRQTWTNLSGHDLVVQVVVNDAPKFASSNTGTVKLSAILRSAPAA